jgi:hypothetical protein
LATIDVPAGWKDFTGGGSDEDLCGEDTPILITPSSPNLSCELGLESLLLTVSGGVPPYSWVASSGVLTVTGTHTATITIHELSNIVATFRPRLLWASTDCVELTPCLGTEEPMRTETLTQTRLRLFDCLGMEIAAPVSQGETLCVCYDTLPFANPIGDNLSVDSDHVLNISWSGTVISSIGLCNPHDIEAWASGECRCTTNGAKTASVTAQVITAGKNCVNGTVWAGAVPFNETISFPIIQGECGEADQGETDYTQTIDVRTQAMVDEECCNSVFGVDIIVTATDAVGHVAVLNIPVI